MAAHETAKRMIIVRLEKSIMGGATTRVAWGKEEPASSSGPFDLIYGYTLAALPEPQIVHGWMKLDVTWFRLTTSYTHIPF